MRALANGFLASGINHFIPHTYSMVLPEIYAPPSGTQQNNWPNSFVPPGYYDSRYLAPSFYAGGFNPQYKLFGKLMRYVQRVCHLLSDGVHKADIAIYYNAEPDWANCAHRDLDDVAMVLTRSGFDFDILPADVIYDEKSIVRNGRLLVNEEHYAALVLPMAELLPESLLARLDELAAQGLKVVFTDKLPTSCERKDKDINGLLAHFSAVPLDKLPSVLETVCGKRLQIAPWIPTLRFYGLEKTDGTDVYIFSNEGRETIDTFVRPTREGASVIYDPWKNTAYRAEVNENGMRLRIEAQQLLAVIFGTENDNLPDFVYNLPDLHVLPLKYDIFIRDAGNGNDFRLLRANSEAVNLTVEEKMTRYCGEFRYDAGFECDAPSATVLEIPDAGDCAELWLNQVYCGASLGPVCRFDIGGKLKKGKNILSILTADNPSYADRFPKMQGALYGTRLPVAKHGFIGDILIG
ncbi:MAG: glycosyl hydrolase [Victivallales bacterium]|nr:glycosyl hydrolase [Victivallales bacterium]